MDATNEPRRSRALDSWDFRAAFAPYAITWEETTATPAFEALQAYGIAVQEMELTGAVEILGHREVLTAVTSPKIPAGTGTAERLPAWVVMIVCRKPGSGGAVVQALIHARTGEVLLGTVVPVRMTMPSGG